TDQIEFANVIILNKTDLVSEDRLGTLKSIINKLNPSAKILESSFSQVDPHLVLNTGLFDFEEAEQSAGWIEELSKDEHTPETEEYGISSFVYRSKKPFDPVRLWAYTKRKFPSTIIRSKGLFWLASRPAQALIWGQAGMSLRADSAGVWWSSMPYAKRVRFMAYRENRHLIEEGWSRRFGDRKNEIVFIGQDMDEKAITEALDACLATEKELATKAWHQGYRDDWPVQRATPPV
ncbi:MAG: GTP-binding protein, partial [Bacteroidota bacterium]